MNRYIYDGATIAAFPNCFLSNTYLPGAATFQPQGSQHSVFWLHLTRPHTDPTKPRWLPHVTPQRTCTVQCLLLHFTPSACFIMVTKMREPALLASGSSQRAFLTPWAPQNPGGGPPLGEPDTAPMSHAPLSFPFRVNFHISVHLLLHTIITPFFTSRAPLPSFPHQHSWLWLLISSVCITRHKKHEMGISVWYGRKIQKQKRMDRYFSERSGTVTSKTFTDHLNIGKCNILIPSKTTPLRLGLDQIKMR